MRSPPLASAQEDCQESWRVEPLLAACCICTAIVPIVSNAIMILRDVSYLTTVLLIYGRHVLPAQSRALPFQA